MCCRHASKPLQHLTLSARGGIDSGQAIDAVLQELLSFQGCEIYDKEWPELVGRTFDEVCAHTLSDGVHSTTRFVLRHAVANAIYRYCTVDSV